MKSKIYSLLLLFLCVITLFSSVCYADIIDIPEWMIYASQRAEELGISFDEYCEEYKEELEAFKIKVEEEEKLEDLEYDRRKAEEKGLTLNQYYFLTSFLMSLEVPISRLYEIYCSIGWGLLMGLVILIFDFFVVLLYVLYKYNKDEEKNKSYLSIFSSNFNIQVKKLVKALPLCICAVLLLNDMPSVDLLVRYSSNNIVYLLYIILRVLNYFFIFSSVFLYFKKSIKNNNLKSYICICLYIFFEFIILFIMSYLR